MQGRASKAPKKELVIESPQQYKSLAAAEDEVDKVPQVVVSHSRHYIKTYETFWFILNISAGMSSCSDLTSYCVQCCKG